MGHLLKQKYAHSRVPSANFSNKCLILTHDGANAKFSTNWDETDYIEFFLRNCYCYLLDDTLYKTCDLLDRALLHLEMDWKKFIFSKIIRSTILLKFNLPGHKQNRIAIKR